MIEETITPEDVATVKRLHALGIENLEAWVEECAQTIASEKFSRFGAMAKIPPWIEKWLGLDHK